MAKTTCSIAECATCGQQFPSGYGRIYCSPVCKEKAKYANAARVPCSICGGPTGYKIGQVGEATHNTCMSARWEHGTDKGYNSNACRCDVCTAWNAKAARNYQARRQAGEWSRERCSAANCERDANARGLCTMHYKRDMRAVNGDTSPSAAWSDTRRSNHHARRARKSGSGVSDKVIIADLIARGETNCQWCSESIDLTLIYPDRYSKSLDHTLPLSRGGAHIVENCTLMHLTCNLSKGARVAE